MKKNNKSGSYKIKLFFLLIVVLLIVLAGYQNKEFLMAEYDATINLYFIEKTAHDVPNAAFLAGFFAAGLLLSFVMSLSGKFKARKLTKELNNRLNRLQEEKERLENEVRSLRSSASVPEEETAAAEEDVS